MMILPILLFHTIRLNGKRKYLSTIASSVISWTLKPNTQILFKYTYLPGFHYLCYDDGSVYAYDDDG